jgi:hypothetical protein
LLRFGCYRFALRRVAISENPPTEWFIIDLFEHADQAAASPVEIAQVLARALARDRLDRDRLCEMAKRHGSRATYALVEGALQESAS